jgi:hypothetical protein
VLYQAYERKIVGEQGRYNVWAFKRGDDFFTSALCSHFSRPESDGRHPTWNGIRFLEESGLLYRVPHLWTDKYNNEGEVIHAYGLSGCPEAIENEIATAAYDAALSMGHPDRIAEAVSDGFRLFVPVPKHTPNVQMIGVYRLRYRPRTTRTREWFGTLHKTAAQWIGQYAELRRSGENVRSKSMILRDLSPNLRIKEN